MMKHFTRLRAYSLSTKGASMSLSVNNHFTLIEARYNDDNKANIKSEMQKAGADRIDILHITSWDIDHCNPDELEILLRELKPKEIECPAYEPHKDCGKRSVSIIHDYTEGTKKFVSPEFVKESSRELLKGVDCFFNPVEILTDDAEANNNSIVKLFRIGSFQVLSLGDCESDKIAQRLLHESIIQKEVDVLILAHHGSCNSVVSPEFLDSVEPRFVVCPVDRCNEYNHPNQNVRNWLNSRNIPYLTTKDGDVLCQTNNNRSFNVWHIKQGGSEKLECSPLNNKTIYPNDSY